MLNSIKNFVVDCARAGSFYAHHTTPRILHPIAIPLLAVTAGPVLKGISAYHEYKYEAEIKRKVAKHNTVGEFETKLRDIFGETSINGYTGHDDTIAIAFNNTSLCMLTPDNRLVHITTTQGYGKNRDEAAKHLIGALANEASADVMGADEKYKYFIAARDEQGSVQAFYSATNTEIDTQNSAPDFTASYLGFGEPETERAHYNIRTVDQDTQARLYELSL